MNVQSIERLRRSNQFQDNDEIEIPLNQTLLSVNQITDENSTSIINTIDYLNDTITNESYPLLKQDLIEINQTYSSINEESQLISTTGSIFNETIQTTDSSEYLSTINETVSDMVEIIQTTYSTKYSSTINEIVPDTIENIQTTDSIDYTSTINEIVSNITESIQTTDSIEHISTIDETTPNTIDKLETTVDGHFVLNETSTLSLVDEIITNYSLVQKDAIIINPDISPLVNETNENSTETSTTKSTPICDQSCQCLKECPYGFELLNDTCQCQPLCQNYPCFGNDTCVITNDNKPYCQPENGTQHDRPSHCYQPRDAGYHDENIRYYNRWYYNPEQDACHLFIYRGLGGNENNFRTLHECHLDCITCAPSADSGECYGHIRMWYFDRHENTCREFEYSGCKGNENKFLRKEQCVDTCIHRIYNL